MMMIATLAPNETDDEPVGIVIAGGHLPEPPPRLAAYVWGQADDPTPTEGPRPRAA